MASYVVPGFRPKLSGARVHVLKRHPPPLRYAGPRKMKRHLAGGLPVKMQDAHIKVNFRH